MQLLGKQAPSNTNGGQQLDQYRSAIAEVISRNQ